MEYQAYTVRPGDTLESISLAHYGHTDGAHRIARANSGRVPEGQSLNPGTVLHIPY